MIPAVVPSPPVRPTLLPQNHTVIDSLLLVKAHLEHLKSQGIHVKFGVIESMTISRGTSDLQQGPTS